MKVSVLRFIIISKETQVAGESLENIGAASLVASNISHLGSLSWLRLIGLDRHITFASGLETDVGYPLSLSLSLHPASGSAQARGTYGSLTARTIYSVVEGTDRRREPFSSPSPLALFYELDLQTLPSLLPLSLSLLYINIFIAAPSISRSLHPRSSSLFPVLLLLFPLPSTIYMINKYL